MRLEWLKFFAYSCSIAVESAKTSAFVCLTRNVLYGSALGGIQVIFLKFFFVPYLILSFSSTSRQVF